MLHNSSLVNLPLGGLDKVGKPPPLDSEHSDGCVGRRGLGDVKGVAHLRHPAVEQDLFDGKPFLWVHQQHVPDQVFTI